MARGRKAKCIEDGYIADVTLHSKGSLGEAVEAEPAIRISAESWEELTERIDSIDGEIVKIRSSLKELVDAVEGMQKVGLKMRPTW